MPRELIGKKLGMTQYFLPSGEMAPLTVIEVGPCPVVQVKTVERDGYCSAQIGFDKENSAKKIDRPTQGHFKRAKVTPHRVLHEVRLAPTDEVKVGEEWKVDSFQEGDWVDVQGVSRGKGFAGGMKRWGWAGGPKTHGSKFHRQPGSIGCSATPSKVLKGKHMPGRMGGKKVTVQKQLIIKIDAEKNLLMLKGGVPGAPGGYLCIKPTVKTKTRKSGNK